MPVKPILGSIWGEVGGRDLFFLFFAFFHFRTTLALCFPRGNRHIVEQMKKNEEERSLQAEHREQEKEQMLAYLERLQEEDLQVTDNQAMLRSPSTSSKAFQGFKAQGME